ncbi:type II secretion system F family protein, partial [Candidatus Bathyarchaeota archaeon]|nr:type II secretion system F family protein [Desulfobacterales bacterium]NIU81609.1 type II secretion system F family protein [Candidatus Bathyarchaeota archaeon]
FHDLPDVLDLMTVCVEAGLSMDAAITRIANNKQFKDSPLAKELKIASYETLAGKPRHDALRDMA